MRYPLRRSAFAFVSALILASTVLSGGSITDAPSLHHVVHPPIIFESTNHTYSENWSGYFVTTAQTGAKYRSVQGTWIVPYVINTDSVDEQFSSSWVGIGGACLDTGCSTIDSTLIQVGTEQDASVVHTAEYFAWYEVSPFSPGSRTLLPNPVRPGDKITASVTCTANCEAATQSWTLTIADLTQQWISANTIFAASSQSSAEWIQEVPMSCRLNCPLAYFSQITFSDLTANGGNPNLSAVNAVNLFGPSEGDATSSTPAGGNNFTVCYLTTLPCNFSTGMGPLLASVLPSSRSIRMGSNATAFATVINAGSSPLTGCTIAGGSPAGPFFPFSYQTTDPSTNLPTGLPNTPVSIAPGGAQSFIFTIGGQNSTVRGLDYLLQYSCAGTNNAPAVVGLSTLSLLVTGSPVPDTIALVATQTNDGILHIRGANGSGAFALATANVGTTSTVQITVDTGSADLPLKFLICQTNASGECLAQPTDGLSTVINGGSTASFAVFATASGPIPFNPAYNRIFVRLSALVNEAVGARGDTVGGASVAVETQ